MSQLMILYEKDLDLERNNLEEVVFWLKEASLSRRGRFGEDPNLYWLSVGGNLYYLSMTGYAKVLKELAIANNPRSANISR